MGGKTVFLARHVALAVMLEAVIAAQVAQEIIRQEVQSTCPSRPETPFIFCAR